MKDVSPKKHTLRGLGGNYMTASEKSKKAEKGRTISLFKPKVPNVESDEDDSNFECCNKSDGKLVHVEIYKEVTERGPALALLPNKSAGEK